MAESNAADTMLIPMGVVAILASTGCFNPFNLLGLGRPGALTEKGLRLSRNDGARPLAPSTHAEGDAKAPSDAANGSGCRTRDAARQR